MICSIEVAPVDSGYVHCFKGFPKHWQNMAWPPIHLTTVHLDLFALYFTQNCPLSTHVHNPTTAAWISRIETLTLSYHWCLDSNDCATISAQCTEVIHTQNTWLSDFLTASFWKWLTTLCLRDTIHIHNSNAIRSKDIKSTSWQERLQHVSNGNLSLF